MSGWYAMKRGWLDHECFKPEGKWSRAEVWVWLVENAAFAKTVIDIGGKPYTVDRGCLCYSERFLSVKFQWSRTALRTFFKHLEAHGVIEISVARTGPGAKSKRNQIRLCNYERYQQGGTKTEPKEKPKQNQRITREQDNTLEANASKDAEASIEGVSILSKTLWDTAIRFLRMHGIDEAKARPIVGRWRKVADDATILSALDACHRSGSRDPVPYITQAIKPEDAPRSASQLLAAMNGRI